MLNMPTLRVSEDHEVTIDGLEVSCNNLWCTYLEKFDNIEDVEYGARIHEGAGS